QKLVAVFLGAEKPLSEKDFENILSQFHTSKTFVNIFTLDNGLKIILYPQTDIPSVALTLALPYLT
ncbi:MAG: hypothetical protein QXO76_04695, partial [Thermoproteota archaeon]